MTDLHNAPDRASDAAGQVLGDDRSGDPDRLRCNHREHGIGAKVELIEACVSEDRAEGDESRSLYSGVAKS